MPGEASSSCRSPRPGRAPPRAGRAPPGLGRLRRGPLRRPQRRRLERRRVRLRAPRRGRSTAPCSLSAVQAADGSAPHRRTLIVLEEGAEAEVWEQYLSAERRPRRRCSTPSSSCVVGPNAQAALRLRPGAVRAGVDLRHPARRGRPRRLARLGRARASARRAARCGWRPSSPARARERQGHRRLRRPRPPAPRLRHHPGARGAQHDLATSPSGACSTAARPRSGAGMIRVDPGAQQTDAFQESRNLLLSKRAHADAIPGLEIEANDVRCTHAAAIAQIDPEQLFYLRSRGLGPSRPSAWSSRASCRSSSSASPPARCTTRSRRRWSAASARSSAPPRRRRWIPGSRSTPPTSSPASSATPPRWWRSPRPVATSTASRSAPPSRWRWRPRRRRWSARRARRRAMRPTCCCACAARAPTARACSCSATSTPSTTTSATSRSCATATSCTARARWT